jgi:hypothetical protein
MENQNYLNREIVSLMPRAGLQDLLPEKKTLVLNCANAVSQALSWKTEKSKYAAWFARSSAISAGSMK